MGLCLMLLVGFETVVFQVLYCQFLNLYKEYNACRFFDMSKGEVEKFIDFCSTDFGEALMDREAELISEKLEGCERVLSIGCGIGSIGERIENLEIVYLDSSKSMLSEAKKRVGGNSLVLGDAENLPFLDSSFSCVYSVTALEFLENPARAIREVARILRSEGRMLAMMLNPSSQYFKSHVKREGSYFRKMRHSPKIVEKYMERYFLTESEYFLGIEDEEIFHTEEPEKASLYVVSGIKNFESGE